MSPNPFRLAAGVAAVLLCASAAHAQTDRPTIAFGTKHALALRDNGDVLSWGDNVMCQLGRPAGNSAATPTLVMRNGKEIAAASEHSLVLTADGKVYGWGMNAEGVLGVGDTYDKCEGPMLVPSLEGKTIAHIATGDGFSVAVTAEGDLFCTGDNSMGQCGIARTSRLEVFTPVPYPELAGNVAAVRAGQFHTLVLTKDRRLYAFGRGRDGQLGNGRSVNGFTLVADMTDVVSFAAGTWHSVVARSDGSVYTWGNGSKSQLCDGLTANRAVPTKVDRLPAQVKIVDVTAGGHSTLLRATDGTVYACGDSQAGQLGTGTPVVVTPTAVPISGITRFALGGAHAAISLDGCAVRMAGYNDSGMIDATGNAGTRTFAPRAGLSLCGPKAPTPLADLVRVPPKGGLSGCWATRVEEDSAASPKFATLRQTMLSVEAMFKNHAAFIAAPVPVRFRTSISISEGTGRMHIKAVPERKADGTRLWIAGCEVIPQLDRIGGAIGQLSIFFNSNESLINAAGTAPALTGSIGAFPEYGGWVVISKGGRLPWIPQTLDDKLTAELTRRERALADWLKSAQNLKAPAAADVEKTYEMLRKSDPAGAEKYRTQMATLANDVRRRQAEIVPPATAALEKQVADVRQYRATFTREQLMAPAVWADAAGDGRRGLDAKVSDVRNRAIAAAGSDRQARQHALERVGIEVGVLISDYDLTNLKPGAPDKAMHVKADPAFPVTGDARVQLIMVRFFSDPDPKQTARLAWGKATKETFDLSQLAALLR